MMYKPVKWKFEFGFKAFLAGFGFRFRPQKDESGFGFKKKGGFGF